MHAPFSTPEPLEPRIAPASVSIDTAAKTATWTDFDGDMVTMKWSSAVAPAFTTHDSGPGLFVDRIALTVADHTNAALTLTVKRAASGDGFVDIGRLDATGVPLKSLAAAKAGFSEIDCGDATHAIGTLTIHNLGTLPTDSFIGTGANGKSAFDGVFTSLKIAGDIGNGELRAGKTGQPSGTVFIGGSIRGDGKGTLARSGYVEFIGSVIQGFTLGGDVIGGDSVSDGTLRLTVGSVKPGKALIKGSVIGSEGDGSGAAYVDAAGAFKLGGSVIGGSGGFSGSLTAFVDSIVIGSSIVGGAGLGSGVVSAASDGKAVIAGSIVGGAGEATGHFQIGGATSLTIGGSIVGGPKHSSGWVQSLGTIGSFVLKGGIFGFDGTSAVSNAASGFAYLQRVGSVKILGGIHAGRTASGTPLTYNGALYIYDVAPSITIKGGIIGNAETNAFVIAGGFLSGPPTGDYVAIGKLSVTGDVAFATIATGHNFNASVPFGMAGNPDAGLGSVTVSGNWLHSSLFVGVNDTGAAGVTTTDTRDAGNATQIARVASITIKGRIQFAAGASSGSGFEAEKIGKLTAAGAVLFQSGDPQRFLDFANYVLVREL